MNGAPPPEQVCALCNPRGLEQAQLHHLVHLHQFVESLLVTLVRIKLLVEFLAHADGGVSHLDFHEGRRLWWQLWWWADCC